ncbi:hypothetical protein AX15_004050 [Amanita polypyramis BW_CC]|nr:hypothetical protein AX15_004050 [Amanita polypyramis BW_CC]
MKCFSAILFFALATVCFGQGAVIGYPPAGKHIRAGKPFTVQLERPDTLTPSTEIAVVISVASCGQRACLPPSDILGLTLYNGSFNPQFHTDVTPGAPPYQNFTVTIPTSFTKGAAQLNIAHFTLVGVRNPSLFETS